MTDVYDPDEYVLATAPYRIYTDPKILSWREDEFERMGFPPEWARVLAPMADACLHHAEHKLLRRGCSIPLAFYILDQRLYE